MVIKVFQPARTDLQPGRDPPSVTHPPQVSLGTTFPQGGEVLLLYVPQKTRRLCVLTPKRITWDLHLSERKHNRKDPQDPPLGSISPRILDGHSGKFYHLPVRPGFLAPGCTYKLATAHVSEPRLCVKHRLPIRVITNAHSQLLYSRWVLIPSPTLQMRKLKFRGITKHVQDHPTKSRGNQLLNSIPSNPRPSAPAITP